MFIYFTLGIRSLNLIFFPFFCQSLQRSHHESSIASTKEEDIDVVDSPPNLPRDPIERERSSTPTTARAATPESDPVTPSKPSASSPINVPRESRMNAQTDEDTAATSSPMSQSRYFFFFLLLKFYQKQIQECSKICRSEKKSKCRNLNGNTLSDKTMSDKSDEIFRW